jgi:hypothetical protein
MRVVLRRRKLASSLRAAQLTTPRARRAIAAMLANILDAAEDRRLDRCSPMIFEHESVHEARDGILELIELLRSETALAPRAVALAAQLAESADSPIVSRCCGTTIGQALAEITAARMAALDAVARA